MREIKPKSLIAVIALRALPGAPLYDGNDQLIIDQALDDLGKYMKVGVDAIKIENDFDVPYIQPPLPKEAVELTIKIAKDIRSRFDGPLGIQMLEAANELSLEIANEAKLDFIRVEAFVYGHVGPDGIIEPCAGKIMRLRKQLGCEDIKIYADVKKKHTSHSPAADLDIGDEIMQAELFLVDGVIVTSKFTGFEPETNDLIKARKATKLPILIGSGMTAENIGEYFDLADYFIVGSTLRKDGKFLAETDMSRLEEFVSRFNEIKQKKTSKYRDHNA